MPTQIKPKRKGFIWASFIFCVAELIVGLATIVLTIYNITSKKREIDVPVISKWRTLMVQLCGLSACLIIVSLLGMWIVPKARQKNRVSASFIVLIHALAFLASIYFVSSFYDLYEHSNMTKEEIFKYTKKSIEEKRVENENEKWIPVWLDTIQEASEKCCGVLTFHDWEIFWPSAKNEVPKSCCLKSRKDCQFNFNKLIYPDLPANNIKVENGCYAEIIERIKELILEARKYCLALAIILGLSLLFLCALYLVVFILKKSQITDEDEDDDDSSIYQPNKKSLQFRPEDQSWQNLEFYRVKTRKRRLRAKPSSNNNNKNLGFSGISIAGGSSLLETGNAFLNTGSTDPVGMTMAIPQFSQPQPGPSSDPKIQVQYKMDPPSSVDNNLQQQGIPENSGLDDSEPDRRHHHHIRGFFRKGHRHHHHHSDAGNSADENPD